jgi:asparagine synthase (glutamine-hydrolysing)
MLPALRETLRRTPVDRFRDYLARVGDLDPLSQALYLDLKLVTPNHCVREVETLGRRFGVATHSPYLDAEFVDFAMTVPAAEKVRGLQLKAAMKKAMAGRLPPETLERRKGGLGGPTRWWITRGGGLIEETLSRESVARRGMFDPAAVEDLRGQTASDRQDYSKLLWSVFTLELWMRRFADR